MSAIKPVTHGSVTMYRRGCGCRPCTDGAARYEQERQLDLIAGRPRRVPITGSRRRLQALVALGYDWETLGRELGVTGTMVNQWARHRTYMYRDTAQRVSELYDRLSMVLPPNETTHQRNRVTRAKNRAAARGWPPPLAWDDADLDNPEAGPRTGLGSGDHDASTVERILSGDWHLPSTPDERREVARKWARSGRSLASLGRLTGWKPERYYRISDNTEEAA